MSQLILCRHPNPPTPSLAIQSKSRSLFGTRMFYPCTRGGGGYANQIWRPWESGWGRDVESKGRVGRPKMWGKLALSFFTINRNPGDKSFWESYTSTSMFGFALRHSWWHYSASMFFCFLFLFLFPKFSRKLKRGLSLEGRWYIHVIFQNFRPNTKDKFTNCLPYLWFWGCSANHVHEKQHGIFFLGFCIL